MNVKDIHFIKFIGIILIVLFFTLFAADQIFAGPGGIIKQAAKTFWGKVVLIGLLIFFAPLIIYMSIKRWFLIRRTRRELRDLEMLAPHFEWMQLKERISDIFVWVHSAWDQKKMELAKDFMTPWYIQNQQLTLDKWERDGLENIVSDVTIKKITPVYVAHDPDDAAKDRIIVEIEAEMRDYLLEKSTGQVVKGDKTLGDVTTVWNLVREGGRWVLSMIEDAGTADDYLREPNKVPAVIREVRA
jgi:hypothetical protein